MKRIIGIILVIALAATMCVVMAGCGENGSTQSTDATQTATTATQAATAAPATQSNNNSNSSDNSGSNSNNSSNSNSGSGTGDPVKVDADGYISEQEAIDNVLEMAGNGAVVVSYYKGATPEGWKAWIVTVRLADGTDVDYYSGYQFGYPVNSTPSENNEGHGINDVYFANVSEQQAGMTALERAGGEGWHIVNYYQSSYEGVDAWAVVVTNDEVGMTRTAYVNGSDCYFG